MKHKIVKRKPLQDMTNTEEEHNNSNSTRPKRDKKPSTRILYLKGLDTNTIDTDSNNTITCTTSTPVKSSRRHPKQVKDTSPKQCDIVVTNSRTRSKAAAVVKVKQSPVKKQTKVTKSNKKVPLKQTIVQESEAKSVSVAKKVPPKSVKFQSDDANKSESKISAKKRTLPSRNKDINVEKPENVTQTENDAAKSTEEPLEVAVENKQAKIPIYKRIKALNTPSPNIDKGERLYEFDFDPKIEPAKPVKKRIAVKKNKTSAPRRKKKNLELNQSEDMAKLIKELKKIRAATQAKKKKALLPKPRLPPPPPPAPLSVSPVSSNAENVSGEKSNETSHATMEMDDLGTSMFNEAPIANSSMIRPFRSPGGVARTPASPWRVQCNEINKFPKNFYVKPSMTPAYERDTSHAFDLDNPSVRVDCSTAADRSENQKEPVDPKDYTLYRGDVSDWRQTSILSYYEKAANKSPRKRGRSPKKTTKPVENPPSEDFLDLPPEVLLDLTEGPEMTSAEPPAAVVENFFGFDESPEFDQENVSPKKLPKIKSVKEVLVRTKKQFGNVLKEVNQKNNAPMRVSPKKVMTLRNAQKKQVEKDVSTNLFTNEEPVESIEINEENNENNLASNDTAQTSAEIRLFENPTDAEAVHFQPNRRSYERKRKAPVKFKSVIETIIQDVSDVESDSDDSVQLKKKETIKRKQKQNAPSKKEEKIANEWAAEFNSLLEEADDFALCIE